MSLLIFKIKWLDPLLRRTFGKFLAWSFISVTDLQALSCLVSFLRAIFFMLWQTFREDILMFTRKKLLRIHVLFVYWKTQNFSAKYNILPFESVQNINNIS